MSEQPNALRLIELFELEADPDSLYRKAADELRRLHEVNQELLEALKLALEGLEKWHFDKDPRGAADYIAAIHDALAEQPAQGCDYCNHPQYAGIKCKNCGREQPAQPSKPWVGLTDEEREHIWNIVGNSDAHGDVDGLSGRYVMDAIEAKLKEKNA